MIAGRHRQPVGAHDIEIRGPKQRIHRFQVIIRGPHHPLITRLRCHLPQDRLLRQQLRQPLVSGQFAGQGGHDQPHGVFPARLAVGEVVIRQRSQAKQRHGKAQHHTGNHQRDPAIAGKAPQPRARPDLCCCPGHSSATLAGCV